MPRSSITPAGRYRRHARALPATLGAGVLAVGLLSALTPPEASAEQAPVARHSAPDTSAAVTHTVTLITGDVVHVRTAANGHRSVSLEPGPDGLVPRAAISENKDHLYVIPEEAIALLSADRLDQDLFDVQLLIDDGYDDASRSTLPVLVDYGRGAPAAREAKASTFDAGAKTVTVPTLGIVAVSADKQEATDFWGSVTSKEDASGAPTALAAGAAQIELDGKVTASDEDSAPQIHAPAAWAAGYDGTGVSVAVLDTGYDPTHPDFAGVVDKAVNFTEDADATDLNGHGTHTAGTIAGTGAASDGLRRGIAPGAHLLIGKVLDHAGTGQDSMVLAGMQWAVAQHAAVISMSLGGDTSDGTDALSRAVDELSASSDSLFVIAAGNNGDNGPSTVTAPGAASSALTVGAVDVNDQLASFSSTGPRVGDGAVKPEVVAPGVDVVAPRAAGTALGPVVDEQYVSLSGTSMATPHVAAVAAILKQEHPTWTGERLKSVISGSTVAIPGTSPFQTGDGRVDALEVTHQDVFSDPVVDLGFSTWPHADLPVTHHPLTYTNLGTDPVTLSLQLPDGLPGVTLASDTVTVPAGGDASVDVALDPTVGGTGSFAGVVEAVPDDGGVPVHTTLSFGLEDERYDLTVRITPREGTQLARHIVGIAGIDNNTFEQRTLDAAPGEQTVTWRVAPGTYSASSLTFGLADDEAQEGVMSFDPSVSVHADTTVSLDETQTRRFDYRTTRPVVSDGSIMMAEWTADSGGYAGYMITGTVDRLYAQPKAAGEGGTINSSLNWMLTQPEGRLTTAAGVGVALRPVTHPDQNPWDAQIPERTSQLPVVDAGTVADLDTVGVEGAVAVVASDCRDLSATAGSLAAAGASALVAYPGEGSQCAGTMLGSSPLLTLQARPFDVARLLAGGSGKATLVTHRNPAYVYDLADAWTGQLPAGATLDGTSTSVATMKETVKSLGGTTSADALKAQEMFIGWIPGRGIAAYGLVRPVRIPSTVTHLVSVGPHWERTVDVLNPQGGLAAELGAPAIPVKGGTTRTDTWFGGPVASSVSPYSKVFGWQGQPYRMGDDLYTYAPPFTDDAGHWGASLFLDEYTGSVSVDGKLLFRAPDPFMIQGLRVPSGPHRLDYRVVMDRKNEFWKRSTHTSTAWGFDSTTPRGGGHSSLPLMGVDYDIATSATNTVAPGTHRIGLDLRMPPGVSHSPVVRAQLALSWNGGRTWRSQPLSDCFTARSHHLKHDCRVRIDDQHLKSASLRVDAEDAAGRTVRQTVIDAYVVR